jgi:small subunit ribosomal protein S8
MLARIKNGQQAKKSEIVTPSSKLRVSVLNILKEQGYIKDFVVSKNDKGFDEITITLKYANAQPVIKEMVRVSKPSRRVYAKSKDLPKFYNGLGIAIISTPKGVMTDHDARKTNLGGEILAKVF